MNLTSMTTVALVLFIINSILLYLISRRAKNLQSKIDSLNLRIKTFQHMYFNKGGRSSGNTTRQVDFYIQELFNNGTVVVTDHHSIQSGVNHNAANLRTRDIIIRRLTLEHPHVTFSVNHNRINLIKKPQ